MPQLRNFISNCSGSIAIVFAFVFPVMVMFVGGMIDVGMAIAARSELAYVTKVACTRLATAASNGMSTSDQLRVANATVAAHLPDTLLDAQTTRIDFSTGSGSLGATGASIYDTKFGKIFNIETIGLTWDETCVSDTRVPTNPATTPCDATVPNDDPNGGLSLTLRDARDQWRDHNEVCTSSGCTRPAAPNEVIVTIIDINTNEVIERDLLSRDGQRGAREVNYNNLSSDVRMTLQPINGSPAILPQACIPSTSSPPPQPPPTTSSTGGCTPPSIPSGTSNTSFGSGGAGGASGSSSSNTGNSGANSAGTANGSWGSVGGNTSTSNNYSGSSGCATVQNGTATSTGNTSVSNGSASAGTTFSGTVSGDYATQSFTSTSCVGAGCGSSLSPTVWLP
jgi:Flp pilus assembly protein TadG